MFVIVALIADHASTESSSVRRKGLLQVYSSNKFNEGGETYIASVNTILTWQERTQYPYTQEHLNDLHL